MIFKTREIIYQDENEFDGTPERIRIIFDIREEVKEFVDKFIKVDASLINMNDLKQELKNTKEVPTAKITRKRIFLMLSYEVWVIRRNHNEHSASFSSSC